MTAKKKVAGSAAAEVAAEVAAEAKQPAVEVAVEPELAAPATNDASSPAGPEEATVDERQAPAHEAGAVDAEEPAHQRHRQLTDEERAELYKQQLKELRLLDLARDMMLTLVTVGYQKLGLTDETRELRDLDEAHLAIELLRGIVGAIEGVAAADEIETYRSTLAQMQMNYARVAVTS